VAVRIPSGAASFQIQSLSGSTGSPVAAMAWSGPCAPSGQYMRRILFHASSAAYGVKALTSKASAYLGSLSCCLAQALARLTGGCGSM